MHVDWDDIKVTGISGIEVEMPTMAKVLIFMDNDLTNINDDHFEINLMAHLLNQTYIVPSPPPRYDYYDDPLEMWNRSSNYQYCDRCYSYGTTTFIYCTVNKNNICKHKILL